MSHRNCGAVAILSLASAICWGNPTGPSVSAGTAVFDESIVNTLTVTSDNQTIIAWDGFSISPHETTRFELSGVDAVVLNRVVSFEPSQIDGVLSSNGVVYLVNPNGVMIGKEGRVETAGFLASTLEIGDDDFLSGKLRFEGESDATVVNDGEVLAWGGDVSLISYGIRNQGEIHAPAGRIDLAAGRCVLFTPDRNIRIVASAPGWFPPENGIDQQGEISAVRATLQADGNLYTCAINQAGSIEATGIEIENGRILLRAENGLVKNSGELSAHNSDTGGLIEVLGERVVLINQAEVDVSGKNGGGLVHLGGSFQGKDPNILQAENTLIEKEVVITADALENGNGGEVIVWAKQFAGAYGTISARGGEISGDGGFVEVSGLQSLSCPGFIDRRAPNGKAGTLLLDPTAITISTGPDTNITSPFVNPNYTFNPANSTTAVINITNLLSHLTNGNVNIDSTNAAAAGTGAITLANALTWTGTTTNTLTINSNGAAADITFNAALTNSTTAGTINITSARDIAFAASVASSSSAGGGISMVANRNYTFAGGAHTISNSGAGTLSMTHTGTGGTFTSSATNTTFSFAGNGSVTIGNANTTSVTLNTVAGSIPYNSSGALTITSAGAISVPTAINFGTVGPQVNISAGAAAAVAVAGTITGTNTFTVQGNANSANILTSSGTFTYNSTGAFLVKTTTGSLAASAALTFGAGAGPVTFQAVTTATLSGNQTYTAGAGTGSLTVTGPTGITVSSPTITYAYPGTWTMNTTAGTITATGTININGTASATWTAVNTTGNIVNLQGALNYNSTGTLTIAANTGGNLLWNTTSVLTVGSGAGPVIFQTAGGGNITFSTSSPVTFTGPAAGSGSFTLSTTGTATVAPGTIAFNTSLDYSAPGACQFTTTAAGGGGSNITTNSSATAWSFRNGSGNVTLNSSGAVTINGATTTTFDAGAGNLSVTSAAGSLTYSGPITFNSGAGKTITMSGGAACQVNSITSTSSGLCHLTAGTGALTTQAGSTLDFKSGSGNLQLDATAGGIATSGAITFEAGTTGTVAMTANTNATITGAVSYASSGLFTITATTGAIATTAVTGTMTFTGSGGLTMNAGTTITNNATISFNTGSSGALNMTANTALTVGATITYNSTAPISLTSTTSSITVNQLMTLNTAALLTFTANTATTGNFNINNQIKNTSTGPITTSIGGDLTVGTGAQAIACQIGSAGGDLTFTVGGNVFLTGGNTANAYSQIGFDSGTVSSNINFTQIGNDFLLNGGTANSCYVVIGHGSGLSTGSGGTRSGNISFGSALHPIPGFVQIQGTSAFVTNANGLGSFAQIGHIRSPATSPAINSGNIDLRFVTNSVSVTGGNRTGNYALIGHGGATSGQADTYTGSVQVDTSQGGSTITVQGGTATDCFAGIGHGAIFNGAGTVQITSSLIKAASGDGIAVKTNDNAEAFIGAYVKSTGGGTGNISVTNITVTSGSNDLEVVGASPSETFNAVLIGALSYTGTMPLTAAGTASSNVTINVGGAFILQSGSESSSTDVFALVQNGIGSPAGGPFSVSVTSTKNIEVYAGNNIAAISSLGPLTLNAGGGIVLYSDHNTGSVGSAFVSASGTTNITSTFLQMVSSIDGPSSSITNSTGNMTIMLMDDLNLTNNALISLTGGSGTLSLTTSADCTVQSNSFIKNLGSGSTTISIGASGILLGGTLNAGIVTTGPLTLTLTDNLLLSTNPGGTAFISTGGALNITAANITLGGIATGLQSSITSTSGDMVIQALNTIEVNDNAKIANLGTGQLSIVVDQQAPVAPAVGNGRFILSPDASVSTASGQNLRIFTARPNSIAPGNLAFGQANSNYVTAGLTCPFDNPTPSVTAIYDTYYNTFAGGYGIPYTLFFKTTGSGPNPPSPTPAEIIANILEPDLSAVIIGNTELFFDLRMMNDMFDCNKGSSRSYIYPMSFTRCSQEK